MKMLVFLTFIAQIAMLTNAMTPNPQPCMICGSAVARLWSMHSHVGDRYLRINPSYTITSGIKVDFGGVVDIANSSTNVDALVQFKDVSTGFPDFETRVIITFYHNNSKYHLTTQNVNDELFAIREAEAANVTDFRDVFSPVRLKFEHKLFFVFESVKHRKYYLGTNGDGETKLVNTHSEAYRDSETLIKLVDPGQAIASAAFGGTVSAKRRKRHANARKSMKKEIVELFPGRVYGKKQEITEEQKTKLSSIRAKVKIPVLNTFTLCFWIRTKDDNAQILAIIYNNSKLKKIPRVDVSIRRGRLVLRLNGKTRTIRKCSISDGIWHHVCISLQTTSRLFIYRDGKNVHKLKFRFSKASRDKFAKAEHAFVYLGRRPATKKALSLTGDLTQVNIWDSYPLFRIQRIATNSACGGGNVVQWKDFLNAASSSFRDVQLYSCDECPKRVGFTFDKIKQNRLV